MYEGITYDVILERMLNRVPDKFDKREGSVIFDAHSPTAVELQILYLELDGILQEAYGDTASREFLIRRCRERGITPYPATKAVLKGRFTPASAEVTGKRFNIGAVNYTVIEKITDGEYQVQCESPGTVGNRQLGVIVPIEYIAGLETSELTEVLIPGEDEEETEDLRKRYFGSFDEKAFGGNVRDYTEKTNEIPGVGGVKVTRVWNSDLRPADMVPSAKVKAWYEGMIGMLDEEVALWLSAVYTAASEKKLTTGGTVLLTILNSDFEQASDALLQSVKQTIDPDEHTGEGYGFAPIGHVVTVESVKSRSVVVRTNIIFDEGYSWANLKDSIENAVSDYLLELRKTWADSTRLVVRVSQIEKRILNMDGIIDVGDTKINGKFENLILDRDEIPMPGGVIT